MAQIEAPLAETAASGPDHLQDWADEHFLNVQSPEYRMAAVQVFQEEERSFDPSYDVTTDDPALIVQRAAPGKEEAITRVINQSSINLAAASFAGSFTDLMAKAENSGEFTDAEIAAMHRAIERQVGIMETGSQVQSELSRMRPGEDGQPVPAHPEDDPLAFWLNVVGFAEPDGRHMLRATTVHGERVILNVTGWSGADIGRASELLQLWAMTENEGQTDFLTSITKLNWAESAAVDPLSLQQASQIVSALLGGGEGHDGDIFDGRDAIGLIRWQAELMNQDHAAARGHRDAARTAEALAALGIKDRDGRIDLDQLRAFGAYSRDHWHTAPDFEAVQTHLSRVS